MKVPLETSQPRSLLAQNCLTLLLLPPHAQVSVSWLSFIALPFSIMEEIYSSTSYNPICFTMSTCNSCLTLPSLPPHAQASASWLNFHYAGIFHHGTGIYIKLQSQNQNPSAIGMLVPAGRLHKSVRCSPPTPLQLGQTSLS